MHGKKIHHDRSFLFNMPPKILTSCAWCPHTLALHSSLWCLIAVFYNLFRLLYCTRVYEVRDCYLSLELFLQDLRSLTCIPYRDMSSLLLYLINKLNISMITLPWVGWEFILEAAASISAKFQSFYAEFRFLYVTYHMHNENKSKWR